MTNKWWHSCTADIADARAGSGNDEACAVGGGHEDPESFHLLAHHQCVSGSEGLVEVFVDDHFAVICTDHEDAQR